MTKRTSILIVFLIGILVFFLLPLLFTQKKSKGSMVKFYEIIGREPTVITRLFD